MVFLSGLQGCETVYVISFVFGNVIGRGVNFGHRLFQIRL